MRRLGIVSLILPLIWIAIGLFILLLQAPGYYFRIQYWPFSGELIEYFFIISLFIFPIIVLISLVLAIISLIKKESIKLSITSLIVDMVYLIIGWVYLNYFFITS